MQNFYNNLFYLRNDLRDKISWAIFIDESGTDREESPYEVLAGVAIEDKDLWNIVKDISDEQIEFFGMRLFKKYKKEAKATQLLTKKVFKLSKQLTPIEPNKRKKLASKILKNGKDPKHE